MGCFDIHHQPSWLVLPCMSSQILVSYGYNPLDYKDLEGSYPCFLVKTAVCRGSEWLFFMKISMKKCLSCTYSPLFFGVFSWKKPSFFGDLGREKWTKLAKNAIFFTFDWLFPEKSMIWPKRPPDTPQPALFNSLQMGKSDFWGDLGGTQASDSMIWPKNQWFGPKYRSNGHEMTYMDHIDSPRGSIQPYGGVGDPSLKRKEGWQPMGA